MFRIVSVWKNSYIIREIDLVAREKSRNRTKRSDPKNIVQVSPFPHAHLLSDFMVLVHEKSRRVFEFLWFYKVRLSSSFFKTAACLTFRRL